jgi:hypothetical protein
MMGGGGMAGYGYPGRGGYGSPGMGGLLGMFPPQFSYSPNQMAYTPGNAGMRFPGVPQYYGSPSQMAYDPRMMEPMQTEPATATADIVNAFTGAPQQQNQFVTDSVNRGY